ncbi:hypothetical protein HA62_09670, partial [Pseudomonas putida]
MQIQRSLGPSVLVGLLVLTGVILEFMVWYFPQWLGMGSGSDRQNTWLLAIPALTFIALIGLGAYRLLWCRLGYSVHRAEAADDVLKRTRSESPKAPSTHQVSVAQVYLNKYYGPFWRFKVR